VWLSGILPSFELVEEVLMRIGGIAISRSSIWRSTQEAGKRLRALEAKACAQANGLPELWDPPSRAEVADQRMGVAMDGALVHIREEGWKEVKVGTVFDVAVKPTLDPETNEMVNLAQAVDNTYVAYLGGPDPFGELVWTEARRRGWEHAQDSEVIGDAAAWIWNQAGLHFGTSRQLVDWFHAKQHLTEAARLLKPEGSPAFTPWLRDRTTLLFQGHADRIANELDKAARKNPAHADALAVQIAYFRNNHRRMNYLEMREEEWPIGSGMVESAAKQFKARFCGPGMRWSRNGAQNLLPIRAAVLSHRFDQLWAASLNSPPV
jgi:hypothetical protein